MKQEKSNEDLTNQIQQLKSIMAENQRKSRQQVQELQKQVEMVSQIIGRQRDKDDDQISTDDQPQIVAELCQAISDPDSVPIIKTCLKIGHNQYRWIIISVYCLSKLGIKYPQAVSYVKWFLNQAKEIITLCLNYLWEAVKNGYAWICTKTKQLYQYLSNWLILHKTT